MIMINGVKIISNVLYLSNEYLTCLGISSKTIEKWNKTSVVILKIDNRNYVRYNTIPTLTRSKLPTEAELLAKLKEETKAAEKDEYFKMLQYAQQTKFPKFQKVYAQKYNLQLDKALEKAMKAAVWEKILLTKEQSGGSNATALFNAFTRLYPGSYSCLAAFSAACTTVKKTGVTEFCIDRRLVRNREFKPNQKFDERHLHILVKLLSVGKGHKAPYMLKKMKIACKQLEIQCPGLTWIKYHRAEFMKNKALFKKRFGLVEVEKTLPFAGLLPAEYADDQWQIDGFTMPFVFQHKDNSGKISYKRPVLVAVMDDYSKYIVGYSVALTENRESLFEALQNAGKKANGLPFEIVSDNHSYNQTKEVVFFKEQINSLGVTWTVSSNPRAKITLENSFLHISQQHLINYPGYLGLSIKAKDLDSRPKQEYIDKAFKADSRQSYDEIKAIAVMMVKEWNEQTAPGRNAAPLTLYHNSQRPHARPVDELDLMRLFNKRTECVVKRWQFKIRVAGQDYEYQLNAENAKLDTQRVTVIYDSLDEVFLFEPGTERFICSLKPKQRLHRALANQTEDDIIGLQKQAAKRKSPLIQGQKQLNDLEAAALDFAPGINDVLSGLTTPKNVMQEAQESADLSAALRVQGIDPNRLPQRAWPSEMEQTAPTAEKSRKSPYERKNNVMQEIILDDNI